MAGMSLPWGDLDMTVIVKDKNMEQSSHALARLERALLQSSLPELESVKFILNANVPVLKFREKFTRIKVDISANNTHGKLTTNQVLRWKEDYPSMRNLMLLLKHYLWMRGANESHEGGIKY
jgi:non-canonical poly(A) RNA polymerase PAPD5/7